MVGAGITGSLLAERLTRQGLDVVIIDREHPGRGSTAASTSMLLWEIDLPLASLTELYNFERASRAYRASFEAVSGLKSLVREFDLPCELREKNSLYLAAGSSAKELLEEHRLRQRAGLPGDFLDHAMLLDACGIARAAAIASPGAADADPLQLARGLLALAAARGARLFDGEAVAFDSTARSVGVRLDNGREIEARSVVLATGYVMPDIVHSTIQNASSSWAIATTPQPKNIWKGGALIWENAKDYLYARTTRAGRIIIGGEDSDEAIEPDLRDRLIPEKSSRADAQARRALAVRQSRYRIPLGRHLRHHHRRPAADRSCSRSERCLRGLWLWRQRHHLQLSRGGADRRPHRGPEFAAVARLCAGPG